MATHWLLPLQILIILRKNRETLLLDYQNIKDYSLFRIQTEEIKQRL